MTEKLEHVWLEAIKDNTPCTTGNSAWTLALGAKIEKFNDGRIVIHNTIVRGDNYDNITLAQQEYFIVNGWEAGRYKLCLETYQRRLETADSKDQSEEDINSKIELFTSKLAESLDNRKDMTTFAN